MDSIDVNSTWSALVSNGFFADYTYEAKRRYQKSADMLDFNRDAWIVEVGCGTGRYHRVLKGIGYTNLVSVDLTFEHIQRAKELNPNGLFVVASGEKLPFKSSIFDALVSNAAIEHFAHPDIGCNEFSRVTTPEAKLIVTSDCYSWRILQILGLYKSKMPIDKTLTYGGFSRLFEESGLFIVDADAWGITQYLRKITRLLPSAKFVLENAQEDSHWSNTKSRKSLGIVIKLRMMFLDENLFVLFKQRQGPSLGMRIGPERGALRLEDVLACTSCGGDLVFSGSETLLCTKCSEKFPVKSGIPIFN